MGEGNSFYADLEKNFETALLTGGSSPAATADSVKVSERGGWNNNEPKKAHNKPIMRLGKALAQMSPLERSIAKSAIETFAREKIGTGDVTSLLTTSISERDVYIRSVQTPLLNFMDSMGPKLVVNDWTYKISERRGPGMASRVNPETGALSRVNKATARTEKYNQLAFWGDPVQTSIISREMVEQQRGINIHQQDVDAEYDAIRIAKEYDFWNGVEQRSFAAYNVPVVGGLLSRTFTNNTNAGGGVVTDAELQALCTQIGDFTDQGELKLAFGDINSAVAIRAMEITRFNGNNPMSFYQYNQIMAQKWASYGLNIDQMYYPVIGPPVPFLHTKYLPAGYIYIITVNPNFVPREAGFKIGGEFGAWLFAKVNYEFVDTSFVLDGGTIDDPAEECRGSLFNVT